MTDRESQKFPQWYITVGLWLLTTAFGFGAGWALLAPREWTTLQIAEHEKRTEEQRKTDMQLVREDIRLVREAVNGLSEKLWNERNKKGGGN